MVRGLAASSGHPNPRSTASPPFPIPTPSLAERIRDDLNEIDAKGDQNGSDTEKISMLRSGNSVKSIGGSRVNHGAAGHSRRLVPFSCHSEPNQARHACVHA
jgi:hypothetical protein